MKILRRLLDKLEPSSKEPGKRAKISPLFEAVDTFLFTPGKATLNAPHVRDATDLKRVMVAVVLALLPAVFMALYNTGFQANLALSKIATLSPQGWRLKLMASLGFKFDPANLFANVFLGALYFLPVYIVTLIAGGFWEVLFAILRKHEVAEGFFVTSLLFVMILPPTIPLWQVALGISFGVVFGKEVFGGVGMNIMNPALVARAFIFFAYPTFMSGDQVWVAVDGVTQATPLAQLAESAQHLSVTWWNAFVGLIPGSMGETSTLACILGAIFLIITGIASWKIMASILLGMTGLSLLFNLTVSSASNPMFAVTPIWHLILGGFAFGAVFMATDPVSSPITEKGKIFYGLLIGILVIMIRVVNPAFPEGMMLSILFANMFAPILDRIFINANIKRRRNGSQQR